MSDLILIDSPVGLLALTVEQVRAALAAAADVSASITLAGAARAIDPGETLLTPEQAAEMTGTKPSWWRSAARTGRVRSTRIGRYPRFAVSDVEAIMRTGGAA